MKPESLHYKISHVLGIVTVYPAIVVREGFDPEAFGVDLTESDLVALLIALAGPES